MLHHLYTSAAQGSDVDSKQLERAAAVSRWQDGENSLGQPIQLQMMHHQVPLGLQF